MKSGNGFEQQSESLADGAQQHGVVEMQLMKELQMASTKRQSLKAMHAMYLHMGKAEEAHALEFLVNQLEEETAEKVAGHEVP